MGLLRHRSANRPGRRPAGLGWYADAGWNPVFDHEGRWSDNYESHLFGLEAVTEF
jgi:hypothetical protein